MPCAQSGSAKTDGDGNGLLDVQEDGPNESCIHFRVQRHEEQPRAPHGGPRADGPSKSVHTVLYNDGPLLQRGPRTHSYAATLVLGLEG